MQLTIAAALAALLPLQRSTAFGPRRGETITTVAANARSIASQYEPPFHQPLPCSSMDAVREEVREEVAGRATTMVRRRSSGFGARAPVGVLCMASTGSDQEDGGGAAPDGEDDLLASYQERLDAEGGATSFRLRGDATQALQEAKEGGDKVLEGAKGVVDWDSSKASAAQVPLSLAFRPRLLPQAERLQLPCLDVAGRRHARPAELAAHTRGLWGEAPPLLLPSPPLAPAPDSRTAWSALPALPPLHLPPLLGC